MVDDIDYTDYPILFVDDEPNAVETITYALKKNFTIDGVSDSNKALEMVKQKEYAVILSDQKMPKMPGFELLQRVKELSPDTVRILITGFSDIEAAIEAVNKGEIFRYISKKISNNERELLIKQAVDWYHTQREMRRLWTLVRSYDDTDVIELQPMEDVTEWMRSTFIEDYDEGQYLLTRKYYSKVEGLATIYFGKLQPDKDLDPELKEKINNLFAHFMIYTHAGDKAKVRKKLEEYLSPEEVSNTIYNRTIHAEQLEEVLTNKIPDRAHREKIVTDIFTMKDPLYQMVVYNTNNIFILQEQPLFIRYTIYPRAQGEKVVIQKKKLINGNQIECREKEDGIIEAFDKEGRSLGTPDEFFKTLINMVSA